MVDVLRRRFDEARAAACSVEARVQRAELMMRLFDDPPPRVQVGRFEITGLLGAGGMGRVYAARDPRLHRAVAIKVLRATGGQHRLAREARAMARINHPNVVQVFDVGRTDDGELFVAMELVEGDTLAQHIERDGARVLPLLLQAGRGLAAAHAAGVLHRDFKPSNVLVTHDGTAKVTDFGLAASGAGDVRAGAVVLGGVDDSTHDGTVLGTPAYMAPEQRIGSNVGEAADQFAFCVTCMEALFGERPQVGEGREVLASQLERMRPRDAESRRRFAALERGLAWEAAARWPTMMDLLDALEVSRRRRRRFVPAIGVGIAIASAIAFGTRDVETSAVASTVGASIAAHVRIAAAEGLVDAGAYGDAMTTLEEAYEIATARGNDREAADAASRLVFVAGHLEGLPREGAKWSRHAAARLSGLDDAEAIEARYHLATGHLRAAEGDDRAALDHFDAALRLRSRLRGPDHPDVAEVLGILGNHAYERGDWATAREHLGRAVAIVEAADHPDEVALAMLLDDLGNAEQQLGDFASAQALYERSLALRRGFRPGHPHLVTSWTNLAYLASARGDVIQAEAYYRKRLDAATAAFGDDDARVGNAYAELGELLLGVSRLDEAQAAFGRALVIAEAVHGPDHGQTARCHAGLGRIHLRRGDLDLAELEIRRAEAAWRAAFAPDHPVHARARALVVQLERARSEL